VKLIFFVVSADSANKKLRPGLEDIVASYKLIGLLEGAPVIVEAMSSLKPIRFPLSAHMPKLASSTNVKK
jgi:hypothetical protein